MQKLKIFSKLYGISSYNPQIFNQVRRSFAGVESDLKALPEDLQTLIKPGKVLMFSLKRCPYCQLAKEFLDERDVSFEIIVADKLGITPEQKNQLHKLTGAKTFPRIFVGKKSIGGFEDIIRLHDKGELPKIFEQENIPFNEI